MSKTLLESQEALEYLKCSRRMLKQLRERGAIAFVREGHRTIRYIKEDLDSFIEANTVKPIARE